VKQADTERWRQALSAYRYPVPRANVLRFGRRIAAAPGWFSFELESGDRGETIGFEQRFRALGREAAEAWFEVIFWKLSSARGLGESRAAQMIDDLIVIKHPAAEMWSSCAQFVALQSPDSFRCLLSALFIVSDVIPVAATFPAFICPERFPMIDRWIARWVVRYLQAYPDEAECNGLIRPSESYIAGRNATLTVAHDWRFYDSWIAWCRRVASVLTAATTFQWRARDVEMAAFQNERSRSPLLPRVGIPP
jgi:hypothetical protein